MQRILVTGAAGFIGFHVARRLRSTGMHVEGLDVVNAYYDVRLKEDRLAELSSSEPFLLHRVDLADRAAVEAVFANGRFDTVIHLAAQAGVRWSLTHPHDYVSSNLVGFLHILEGARHHGIEHLVYASSSSVYGLDTAQPFSEHQLADHPMSLYAATKRSNELMAHSYSHLYRIPTTGLRFFTVYGPWGRPDMALFLFTKAILEGRPIQLFNHGQMQRDFTYVDDIVEGIVRIAARPAQPSPSFDPARPDPAISSAPFRVYNIGNSKPVALLDYIGALEAALGRKADREMLPMQPGDVAATWADCADLGIDFDYRPATPVQTGIDRFVSWYRSYYRQ